VIIVIPQLVFVMRAFADAGNKNLPHARRTERTHLMNVPVPVVEIANHTDALRVRRPDGEARSRHAVHRPQLRAEFIVKLPFVAFAKQIQIILAQRRQKRIGIANRSGVALMISENQFIRTREFHVRNDAFKNPGLVDIKQLNARFPCRAQQPHLHLLRAGSERPDHRAGPVGQRMHSQCVVRRTMFQLGQPSKFFRCENHVAKLATRFPNENNFPAKQFRPARSPPGFWRAGEHYRRKLVPSRAP
jgi:hypothetical protein